MTDDPDREARAAWQELVEKDDRTSPSEYPDMALITFDELCAFMTAARRPDAGLRVTEEAVEAAGNAFPLSPMLIRRMLIAALPHLRPDASRDDKAVEALAAAARELIETSWGTGSAIHVGKRQHDMLVDALALIDADRARAEDKEAGPA